MLWHSQNRRIVLLAGYSINVLCVESRNCLLLSNVSYCHPHVLPLHRDYITRKWNVPWQFLNSSIPINRLIDVEYNEESYIVSFVIDTLLLCFKFQSSNSTVLTFLTAFRETGPTELIEESCKDVEVYLIVSLETNK